MSEDAKAFGPASQPSELREALRGLIEWAESPEVGGAFTMAWVHGYRISEECNKKAQAAGDAARAALAGAAPSGHAEGAKALEIARAEGKAEGLARVASLEKQLDEGWEALVAAHDFADRLARGQLWNASAKDLRDQLAVALRAMRSSATSPDPHSLIPAAPGGSSK